MTLYQSAIVPEAGPFALYTQLKIKSEPQKVVEKLQTIPKLVAELNHSQPGAELTSSVAFSKALWSKTNQPMPEELIDFTELGKGQATAPASDVDVLIHCHSNRHDLHFYLLLPGKRLFIQKNRIHFIPRVGCALRPNLRTPTSNEQSDSCHHQDKRLRLPGTQCMTFL